MKRLGNTVETPKLESLIILRKSLDTANKFTAGMCVLINGLTINGNDKGILKEWLMAHVEVKKSAFGLSNWDNKFGKSDVATGFNAYYLYQRGDLVSRKKWLTRQINKIKNS